jgi:hypothetical protein
MSFVSARRAHAACWVSPSAGVLHGEPDSVDRNGTRGCALELAGDVDVADARGRPTTATAAVVEHAARPGSGTSASTTNVRRREGEITRPS